VVQRPDRTSVFAQFTVRVDNRSEIQEQLKKVGIPTAVHYPTPLNMQPGYQGLCCPECTPNAVALSNSVMSLPMSPDLSEADQERVIDELRRLV
jgi:UDP-2-acetamido-2-deoxy-ribo-hexuluronate aminotransferase